MSKAEKRKNKYNKKKFIAAFIVAMGLFALIRHGFSLDIPLRSNAIATQIAQYDATEDIKEEKNEVETEDSCAYDTLSVPSSQMQHNGHRVIGVHSWIESFPDIQPVQLEAAKRNGIKPCSNRRAAQQLVKAHKLVNISNSPLYVVDDLEHSMPFLVPKAQHLLNTICLNFMDSLQIKGMPIHLPMVTSVLRTTDDVSKLQIGNKNATTNSCHCYGTTVDITYNRFVPLTGHYDPEAEPTRWDLPMKQVMAEVLRDLREQGLCYVKYEYKQACFHLTVR